MEIVGDTMLGTVGGVTACGSHEQLAAAKLNVGLTVAGQSAGFRNLKIWEATVNPDWNTVKAALPKGDPLPPPRGTNRRRNRRPGQSGLPLIIDIVHHPTMFAFNSPCILSRRAARFGSAGRRGLRRAIWRHTAEPFPMPRRRDTSRWVRSASRI
jgi:hypothetical protein